MKRRRRRVRWLTIPLIVVFLAVSAVTAYGHLAAHRVDELRQASLQAGQTVPDSPLPAEDINILLAGVDQRPHDVGRSDTLMLLHYGSNDNRLHLLSIPRDTEVELPGHGRQKINAAYVYGGIELMKQTVSDLTGLRVDRYVQVNMEGFERVVDALGGVDVEIKQQMDYEDPKQGLRIHFTPGKHHLNGHDALLYVRWRGDPRADIGRIERQQDFLASLAQQALTPAILPRLPALITSLSQSVQTDIPISEQVGLAVSLIRGYHNGLTVDTLPGNATYIDRISYVVVDRDELKKLMDGWAAAPTAR